MLNRNVLLLAASQACYLMAIMTMMTFAGLAGKLLAPDPQYATFPISLVIIATALSTAPISLLMQAKSRRFGFRLGAFSGLVGGSLAILSLITAEFSLLCIGMLLLGPFQASAQYYRFAAAESVSPALVPKAISAVLVGGLAAAFLVAPITNWLGELFPNYTYIGAFILITGATGLAFLPLAFLKPLDKPLEKKKSGQVAVAGRSLGSIARTPDFIVAVTNGALGYAMMTFVMTATPLAMDVCDFSTIDTAITIQWHTVAMFLPGLFTGILIGRFGVLSILLAGHTLFIAAFLLALSGITLMHFNVALVALGVGWNFCMIGSSSLLTTVHSDDEKGRVQGLNEFLVFTTAALASFSAGIILDSYGWVRVNQTAFVMLAIASVVTVSWGLMRQKSNARAQQNIR